MWSCIKTVPEPDYLQFFKLEPMETMQKIIHEQEKSKYRKEYLIKSDKPITANDIV